jgi:hypothetical protein
MARQQQFVSCPFCGDPVPGPFPGPGEFIHCTYCQEMFVFGAQSVSTALIEFHEPERRWTIVPIHSEMDIQATRLLELCTQSAPGCIVHVTPVGPDSFRVKVKDGENTLIDSDSVFYTHEIAEKSDNDLWSLLETVSQQRIKRL